MLIVAAKVTTAPGKRDEFIKAAQPCIAATRQEEGCAFYELYASTENPDLLMYYERWTDKAALDKHIASDHMKAFGQVKAEQALEIGQTEITLYEVPE